MTNVGLPVHFHMGSSAFKQYRLPRDQRISPLSHTEIREHNQNIGTLLKPPPRGFMADFQSVASGVKLDNIRRASKKRITALTPLD